MPQGKLQLGTEALPVEYELQTERQQNLREITGVLKLKQNPLAELAKAILNMTGAYLITESGQSRWIEFRTSIDAMTIEFVVPPPTGRI
jgi:hypothetical protein